jgi:DNA-3-methyladenine glycosylase
MKNSKNRKQFPKLDARGAAQAPLEELWHLPARMAAPALLGRQLCRRGSDGVVTRVMITEVEAYCGPSDLASHASKGQTPRNAVMFGPPGFWYVYLCYGVHWMLNLVTGPEGYASAVLLRGVVGANGPGRLTKALQVDRSFERKPCLPATDLWIEGIGNMPAGWRRQRGPRIGVDYAGPHWAAKPYRW